MSFVYAYKLYMANEHVRKNMVEQNKHCVGAYLRTLHLFILKITIAKI